jgi:prepilin peptidase CpaA
VTMAGVDLNLDYPLPLAAAYLGLLGAAVVFDVRFRRIPNAIAATIAVGGVAAQVAYHGWLAGLVGLGGGLGIIILLWLPWTQGGLGGGDVKLAGAAAAWFGLASLPVYVLTGALAGGIVALICYALSRSQARGVIRSNLGLAALLRAWPVVGPGGEGRVSVPYAVAIATGALCATWGPTPPW